MRRCVLLGVLLGMHSCNSRTGSLQFFPLAVSLPSIFPARAMPRAIDRVLATFIYTTSRVFPSFGPRKSIEDLLPSIISKLHVYWEVDIRITYDQLSNRTTLTFDAESENGPWHRSFRWVGNLVGTRDPFEVLVVIARAAREANEIKRAAGRAERAAGRALWLV
jgi:hypothetical protein